MNKTELDFQASGKNLRKFIELYKSGSKEMYLPISVELRKLLCDKNPLLPRARPNFEMHKLHWTKLLEGMPSLREAMVMMIPGKLTFDDSGNSSFQLSFADPLILISIKEWIGQPFLNIKMTIWGFIKSVADKEGAHSDTEYDDNLLFAKGILFVEDESHIQAIVAIADYLLYWGDKCNIWAT